MHASIGGVEVIYPDTSFVDNRDMDKINLQKFPDTVYGPALEWWRMGGNGWEWVRMVGNDGELV